MLIEAFILDGNQSLLHVFGDVLVFNPEPSLVAADGDALLPVAGQILVPDRACFTQLIVFQREIQLRGKTGFDIIGKNTGKQNAGNQQQAQ